MDLLYLKDEELKVSDYMRRRDEKNFNTHLEIEASNFLMFFNIHKLPSGHKSWFRSALSSQHTQETIGQYKDAIRDS
jgi:hypothetical protein